MEQQPQQRRPRPADCGRVPIFQQAHRASLRRHAAAAAVRPAQSAGAPLSQGKHTSLASPAAFVDSQCTFAPAEHPLWCHTGLPVDTASARNSQCVTFWAPAHHRRAADARRCDSQAASSSAAFAGVPLHGSALQPTIPLLLGATSARPLNRSRGRPCPPSTAVAVLATIAVPQHAERFRFRGQHKSLVRMALIQISLLPHPA